MSEGRRVRWGILATGRITHQFVQDFPEVSNGEVVAVAARKKESADAFAAQYGIPRAYGSYGAMLDDREVDAVYIATPMRCITRTCSMPSRRANTCCAKNRLRSAAGKADACSTLPTNLQFL